MDNFDLRKFLAEQKEVQRIDELNVSQLAKLVGMDQESARKIYQDIRSELFNFWEENNMGQGRPSNFAYYLNRILSAVGYGIDRERKDICAK